jgi:hypothetical protein
MLWNQGWFSLALSALHGSMCSNNFVKGEVCCLADAEPGFLHTSDDVSSAIFHFLWVFDVNEEGPACHPRSL